MSSSVRIKDLFVSLTLRSFDGTAMQLFGHWIKWLLLTIITLGIYGFWLNIRLQQWITKHTHTLS